MITSNRKYLANGCLLSIALIFATGCTADNDNDDLLAGSEVCREDCDYEIGLPDELDLAPAPPELIRVTGDTEVNFRVPRQGRTANRTVLSFEQPAFLDEDQNPVYTLELQPGDNRYMTRSFDDNVCHRPAGCRYVVINVGRPGRASVISSPHIIIEQR